MGLGSLQGMPLTTAVTTFAAVGTRSAGGAVASQFSGLPDTSQPLELAKSLWDPGAQRGADGLLIRLSETIDQGLNPTWHEDVLGYLVDHEKTLNKTGVGLDRPIEWMPVCVGAGILSLAVAGFATLLPLSDYRTSHWSYVGMADKLDSTTQQIVQTRDRVEGLEHERDEYYRLGKRYASQEKREHELWEKKEDIRRQWLKEINQDPSKLVELAKALNIPATVDTIGEMVFVRPTNEYAFHINGGRNASRIIYKNQSAVERVIRSEDTAYANSLREYESLRTWTIHHLGEQYDAREKEHLHTGLERHHERLEALKIDEARLNEEKSRRDTTLRTAAAGLMLSLLGAWGAKRRHAKGGRAFSYYKERVDEIGALRMAAAIAVYTGNRDEENHFNALLAQKLYSSVGLQRGDTARAALTSLRDLATQRGSVHAYHYAEILEQQGYVTVPHIDMPFDAQLIADELQGSELARDRSLIGLLADPAFRQAYADNLTATGQGPTESFRVAADIIAKTRDQKMAASSGERVRVAAMTPEPEPEELLIELDETAVPVRA